MPLTDLHCDTLTTPPSERMFLEHVPHTAFAKGQRMGSYTQVYAIWTNDDLRGQSAVKRFWRYWEMVQQWSGTDWQMCDTWDSVKQAMRSGKVAGILSVENGAAFGGEMANVDRFAKRGVCMVGLTWNGANELAGGCHTQTGLTELGRTCLTEMERLGLALDVSHLSHVGVKQALEIFRGAICASHSNASAVCDHPRNLTNEEIKLIASRGGVGGINYYPPFVNGTQKNRFVDCMHHLQHFVQIGGEEFPALGGDFDGAELSGDIRTLCDMPTFYEKTAAFFHSYRLADRIFYQNATLFLKEVLTNRLKDSTITEKGPCSEKGP